MRRSHFAYFRVKPFKPGKLLCESRAKCVIRLALSCTSFKTIASTMQFLSLAPVSSATTDHNVAGDGHEGEGVDRWCPSISAERATQKSAELHESKIGNSAAPVTNPQGEVAFC